MKKDNKKVITEYDLGFEESITSEKRLSKIIMSLFGVNTLNHICKEFADDGYADFMPKLIEKLNIELKTYDLKGTIEPKEMLRNADNGAIVVVNQPHGLADLVAILSLVAAEPRAKILLNNPLAQLPQIQGATIPSEPKSNTEAAKEAIKHLKNEGILITFPAQDPAHWNRPVSKIKEQKWTNQFIRLAQITQKPIIPIFINGHNSLSYQIKEFNSKRLAKFNQLKELLKLRGQQLKIVVGNPIQNLENLTPNLDLTATCRKALIMLRETLHDEDEQKYTPNKIKLQTQHSSQLKKPLHKIKWQELKNDPSAEMIGENIIITTPDRFNEKTKRRVALFHNQEPIFEAQLIKINKDQTHRMQWKFEVNKNFDLLPKRITTLAQQGVEISDLQEVKGYENEVFKALGEIANYLDIKYIWLTTELRYNKKGLLLSETLKYLYATARRSGQRNLVRGLIARSGMARRRRLTKSSTLGISDLPTLEAVAKIMGQALTEDQSSMVELESFTKMLYENGARALKIAMPNQKWESDQSGEQTNSLAILTLLKLG